jgi:hypothetical protein
MPQDLTHHLTRRVATILGLAGIAVIHLLDLPGKFAETPYLGWAYLAMILACAILIERIATNPKNTDYLAAAVVAASVLAGFVVNRTVGMPGATDDIGNWLEPLGFLSLFVEAFTVWQALAAYRTLRHLGSIKSMSGSNQSQDQARQYSVSLG